MSRSQSSLVSTEQVSKNVFNVVLRRAPANALNRALLNDITATFEGLRAETSCQAVVLQSSSPKVFSAGIDLSELYDRTEAELRGYWGDMQRMWRAVYGAPFGVVAGIHGHAVAGGCMLAMAADFRVMASDGSGRIGMNESQIGLVAPFWMADSLRRIVGEREAERMLVTGTLLTADDAHRSGLVDKSVPAGDVTAAATQYAESLAQIPARAPSKLLFRRELLEKVEALQGEDTDTFVRTVQSDTTQKVLKAHIEKLSQRGSGGQSK